MLVVDDDESFREVFLTYLESFGIRALGAIDGVEALALVAADAPTVIVCDMLMPRMGGQELLEEMRRRTHDVPPVILLSGLTLDVKEVEALRVHRVLQKPVNVLALLATIRELYDTQAAG